MAAVRQRSRNRAYPVGGLRTARKRGSEHSCRGDLASLLRRLISGSVFPVRGVQNQKCLAATKVGFSCTSTRQLDELPESMPTPYGHPNPNPHPTPSHSYAERLMEAADAAGYAFCLAFGEFDANDALVNGTEGWVHNPTEWSGTGQPDIVEVDYHYARMPDEGKPTVCSTWNGKEWVAGKTEWPGTVATPVTLNPMEIQVREWGRSWCVPQHVCATLEAATAWHSLPLHHCCTPHPVLAPSRAAAGICGESLCQPVVCGSHPDSCHQVRRPGCQSGSHEHSLLLPWGRQVGLAVQPRCLAKSIFGLTTLIGVGETCGLV